jgi:hypothetical protein
VDSGGRTIFVADEYRGDGKRFVVRADENLTAFVELESVIRASLRLARSDWLDGFCATSVMIKDDPERSD